MSPWLFSVYMDGVVKSDCEDFPIRNEEQQEDVMFTMDWKKNGELSMLFNTMKVS